MADKNWYLFLRYHGILCQRLGEIYTIALRTGENDETAISTDLSERNTTNSRKFKVPASKLYNEFLIQVKNFIDKRFEDKQYETILCDLFGKISRVYIAFTFETLLKNCVKSVIYLI